MRPAACLLAVLLVPAAAAAQPGSPAGPVPVERLAARRAALFEALGDGAAVLRAAEVKDIEGDYPQDSDFREDNDFFYLTGVEAPGAWLVLVARRTGDDRVVLFLPTRSAAAQRYLGPVLGPGPEATALTGIPETHAADSLDAILPGLLRGMSTLWVKRGTRSAAWPFVREVLEGRGGDAELADLRPQLATLRLVKDADELGRLRRAIVVTGAGQAAGARAIRPGAWEYEVEADVEGAFRRGGAERLGFPSIIGSGPNSTVLHYDKARRRMAGGELVVVDVGAEFGYYTADVTRTWPVSGRFTPRQRRLYELVLGAQEAAIAAVRPGVTVAELNRVAREWFRTNSGDVCGTESCERYFIHGLSHWLGMDVHDVGSYAGPLAPGMVLTIEPGLYLPEEGIGIRIEDDVLVTADGREVLSAAIPRAPDAVERAMRSRVP
jgi:Xaa-Pro aminopeptidase